MKLNFDVVIVGSGVAGMTAAIYLKRANINCCVIEKEIPGGQITKTSTIENYPGFLNITGPDLAIQIQDQLKNLSVPYRYGNVIEILDHNDYKVVKTSNEEITCKGIILALGRMPRKLGLEKEEQLMGRGLSWCAICDGPLYKNQSVAVIGGGNSALEEALYLSEICKKVTIVHRSDHFTAQQYLIDKIKTKKNVKVLFSTEVKEYQEKEQKLIGLTLKNNKDDKVKHLKVTGCFIYIGHIPNTEFLSNLPILDSDGYLETMEGLRTKIPFIYGAGDVVKKDLYQIVTAMSDGARAATSFIKDFEQLKK